MTIYERLKAAGEEIDNHESDLYVRATPSARAIIHEFIRENPYQNVSYFIDKQTGAMWADLMAAYDPFWTTK